MSRNLISNKLPFAAGGTLARMLLTKYQKLYKK